MYKQLLMQFLDENRPAGKFLTAPALMHYQLKKLVVQDADEQRREFDILKEKIMPERLAEAAPGIAKIKEIASGSDLVQTMLRKQDPLNNDAIVDKAMEFEEDVVPEVVRRFKNNMTMDFIEMAVLVMVKSKFNMADEIMGYFDDMRSPYAQSLALVVLGFKADENAIPWLISKYHQMKKRYPRDSHYLGAYYGLEEIAGRFIYDI